MTSTVWTTTINRETQRLCRENTDLWFPKGFGFDPFSQDQIKHAITDPKTVQFRLNKAKGRGILYGVRHTALRRQIANILPDEQRSKIWKTRLQTAGIWAHLEEKHNTKDMFIADIGMGHTVLHLYPPHDPSNGIVLKQEELPHHQLFCQLLEKLQWANTYSDHHIANGIGWQITPYIPGKTVSDSACQNQNIQTLASLAKFAALGDMIGREDRHNENYIVGRKQGCIR